MANRHSCIKLLLYCIDVNEYEGTKEKLHRGRKQICKIKGHTVTEIITDHTQGLVYNVSADR